MKRTEKQIAEFMAYYDGTTDRKQALEELARVEGKSPAEIRKICEKYKSRAAAPAPEAPEETEEKLPEGWKVYVPKKHTAGRTKKSSEAVGKTEAAIPAEKTEKLPEAYPGQIYDDCDPEEIPVKSGTARNCKELNVFAVLLLLQEAAKSCGKTEIAETYANADKREARVRFRMNERMCEIKFAEVADD